MSTAASFTTNTNWQAYVPEQTMSYFTQMFGLATHNFWSAAVGMALAIACLRGKGAKSHCGERNSAVVWGAASPIP